MEREAEKKQEYLQRAKVDVKDILNDKQLKSIRVAELYQSDDMMQAQPDRGELLSAEQYYEGDDSDLMGGPVDDDDFDENDD